VAEAMRDNWVGMEVIAEVLPQDKDQVIQKLQQNGAVVRWWATAWTMLRR